MKQLIYLFGFFLLLALSFLSCSAQEVTKKQELRVKAEVKNLPFQTGAEVLLSQYVDIVGQRVALLVNPTSMIGDVHLVDALLERDVALLKIFAPEHGFRGNADAGEEIKDGFDPKTGIPIVSLYGSHKKPSADDLADVDIVIFDIQDVGVRFYTYISTLHYLMEACAENGVKVIVLDRPNPNGDIVDGNVLDMEYTSFVGKHPIPVLHGMTVGEYAQMINGEGWLPNGLLADLTVIPCKNYTHNDKYSLPVKPSPNLPDDRAIQCYPSTCFFEGTIISEGRGTSIPFQVFGAPSIDSSLTTYSFIPKSMPGAKYPKFKNQICYGFDISEIPNDFEERKGVNLNYLISMYNLYPEKDNFFLKNGFFDKLAGGTELREAIVSGMSAELIRASWADELADFKSIRSKYLLYPDFE